MRSNDLVVITVYRKPIFRFRMPIDRIRLVGEIGVLSRLVISRSKAVTVSN